MLFNKSYMFKNPDRELPIFNISFITSVACKEPNTPPMLSNTPLLEQLFILLSVVHLQKDIGSKVFFLFFQVEI